MTFDLGELYRTARARVTALVSDDVASVPVPATPAWDVHDVVAHLAGVAEDVCAGNLTGAATDPWTEAQVARARDRSVTDLLDRWARDAPTLEGFLSQVAPDDRSSAPLAVIDLHTHEADLLGALGRPVELPAEFLAWAAPFLEQGFHRAVAAAGLAEVTVDADPLEWVRGRLGRRTTDEVRGYGWSADPDAYLDVWFVFGRAERSLGERAGDDGRG